MPAYSTEHNRIQTRQLLYHYFTLDIELVFLQFHLDDFALLNPASIFFAVSIELHEFQYKAWQMMSRDDDSAILQEGLSGSSDQSMYSKFRIIWPSVSKPDSSNRVLCLTWMRPSSFTELYFYSVPLVTLVDPRLSTNLPSAFMTDGGGGSPSDLDEAIKLHAATLALCPPGHIPQLEYINNLATSLCDRFQQHGTLSELEDVIELHRATLIFCPLHHALRSNYMNNLAVSLCDRFRQQSALSDLDEATEFYRAALALRFLGHSLTHVSTTLPAALQPKSWNVPPHLTWTREAIKLQSRSILLTILGDSYFSTTLTSTLKPCSSSRVLV